MLSVLRRDGALLWGEGERRPIPPQWGISISITAEGAVLREESNEVQSQKNDRNQIQIYSIYRHTYICMYVYEFYYCISIHFYVSVDNS